MELVDAPLAPAVQIDSKGQWVVLIYRDAFKSIAELSETELRLGGLRINPKTNIGSRTTFYNNLKVKRATDDEVRQVSGLPDNPRLSGFSLDLARATLLSSLAENRPHSRASPGVRVMSSARS